jgi:biopolymer transport protein ExbD
MRNASAAVAGVLLMLSAIVAATVSVSVGLPVVVVSRSAYPPNVLCMEQRLVIVIIDSSRRLYINSEPVSQATLPNRLEALFKTRAEPVAYVYGAPELSYGEVANVVGIVRRAVGNVGLLTSKTIPTMSEPVLRGAFPIKSRWD